MSLVFKSSNLRTVDQKLIINFQFSLFFSFFKIFKKCLHVIYQIRETSFHHIQNKRVENTTPRSGVFFTKFEVFGNRMKHCIECLIYLLTETQKRMSKRRNKIVKIYVNQLFNYCQGYDFFNLF